MGSLSCSTLLNTSKVLYYLASLHRTGYSECTMGSVKVKATVRNIYKPKLQTELKLIADIGAIYTIINRKHIESLQIKSTGKRQFKIADGKVITREVGLAQIEINKEITHSTIVFGEPEDAQVLGVTTLEELGLQVDPVAGQLKPLELLLLLFSTENIFAKFN